MLSILHHWSKNKKLVMSRKKFISYPAPSTNVPEIQMHSRASYSFSQTSLLLNIFILTYSVQLSFFTFFIDSCKVENAQWFLWRCESLPNRYFTLTDLNGSSLSLRREHNRVSIVTYILFWWNSRIIAYNSFNRAQIFCSIFIIYCIRNNFLFLLSTSFTIYYSTINFNDFPYLFSN